MLSTIEKLLDREPEMDDTQVALDATPFMKQYRQRIGLIALSIALAFASLVVFYITAKRIKPPALLFIQTDGNLSAIQAEILPNQSREAVKDWAREAVSKAYTLDFLNADQALASAEPYFTSDAWPIFRRTMMASPLRKEVLNNKLNVSIVSRISPIIDSTARDSVGDFAWKVLIPATLSYAGDAPTKLENILVRVTVVRVPTTENPKGLGVLQMTTGPLPR